MGNNQSSDEPTTATPQGEQAQVQPANYQPGLNRLQRNVNKFDDDLGKLDALFERLKKNETKAIDNPSTFALELQGEYAQFVTDVSKVKVHARTIEHFKKEYSIINDMKGIQGHALLEMIMDLVKAVHKQATLTEKLVVDAVATWADPSLSESLKKGQIAILGGQQEIWQAYRQDGISDLQERLDQFQRDARNPPPAKQ